MCLESIYTVYPKRDKTEGFGWKVFVRIDGQLYSAIRNDKFEEGKKYKRKIRTIYSRSNIPYDTGFHIFTNRQDARLYHHKGQVVRKVKYKGIVCDGCETIVDNGIHNLKVLVVKQLELV